MINYNDRQGEGNCPACDGPTVERTSMYGSFYGCIDFPICRGTRNKVRAHNRPTKTRTKGKTMNEVNVLLATNEQFKFVLVKFQDEHNDLKLYTYKTTEDVEEGNYAIVFTPSNKYEVVKVVSVHSPLEVDFEVKYSYKWIVQVLDTNKYESNIALEKSILAEVKKSKNKRLIDRTKNEIFYSLGQETCSNLLALLELNPEPTIAPIPTTNENQELKDSNVLNPGS